MNTRAEYHYKWSQANLDRTRQASWKHMGILNSDGTPFASIDYDRLYQVQQGKCAICAAHQSQIKYRLHVDHDHETGVVRGLLCFNCNAGVGKLKDSVDLLQKSIAYLTERI